MSDLPFVFYLVVACVVMFGGVCLVQQCNDCDARGGVMVRSWGGGYACVAAPPKGKQ